MSIPRRVSDVPRAPDTPAAYDEKLGRLYPCVLEHLTARVYEDGGARVPCTLSIFAEDGVWKCCLNDKDTDSYCFVSGETLDGLLRSLEDGLSGGGLDWRRRKPTPGKGSKRA